jgi:hypothetical protein
MWRLAPGVPSSLFTSVQAGSRIVPRLPLAGPHATARSPREGVMTPPESFQIARPIEARSTDAAEPELQ